MAERADWPRALPAAVAAFVVFIATMTSLFDNATAPYLDWPRQQPVGTHTDVSHVAATPPGPTVTVRTLLAAVDGRRLTFEVDADDGVDVITTGRHERIVIDADPFVARVGDKVDQARREQAGRPFDGA